MGPLAALNLLVHVYGQHCPLSDPQFLCATHAHAAVRRSDCSTHNTRALRCSGATAFPWLMLSACKSLFQCSVGFHAGHDSSVVRLALRLQQHASQAIACASALWSTGLQRESI